MHPLHYLYLCLSVWHYCDYIIYTMYVVIYQQHEITNALFSRVKFFRLFLTALLSFSKEKVRMRKIVYWMQVFLIKCFLETVSNVIQELCGTCITLHHEPKSVKIGRNIVLLSFKCKTEHDYGLYVHIIDKKNPFIWCIIYNLSYLFVLQCEGIPQAQKLICQLLELLPIIRDTICMGIQPDNKEVGKNGRYM